MFVILSLCDAPPAPPQSVRVERWLMTWAAAPDERDVTYTVQYSSFDSRVWTDVTACVRISSTECNVAATKAKDERGCVMLRVQAERRALRSDPVQACSQHGDSCSPEVRLSARPGSLTVHLTGDHSLAVENAAHAKHRVCWGKEGEPLKGKVSSVSIPGLEEGQRYCVEVQYTLYNKTIGVPSCNHCALIPESSKNTWIILTVVFVVIPLILTPIMAYIFMFHCQRVKRWLRITRYQIPEDVSAHTDTRRINDALTYRSCTFMMRSCDLI
uniref:Fibronectin type-III domain-containing protein n=1 Tax=Mola mola TaxID=94237 RepID=A0A3Q3XAD0_MOLML